MYNVAVRGPFKGLNPRVTLSAMVLILAVGALGALHPGAVERVVAAGRGVLSPFLSWYYVVIVSLMLVLVIWLGTGRFKNVRLGRDDETPEFTTFAWLTMLFAAGMGVGLLFWAVAEPVSHFAENPLTPQGGDGRSADSALMLTYFHWGLNAWAVFAMVGLILAYFSFRRGLPLSMRSAMHPMLGKYIHTWPGDLVDLLAIVATVFGIATTLGFGIQQLNTGISQFGGIPVSDTVQVTLTIGLMLLAILTVITGLQKGVRLISEANFWFSVALLVILLAWGPTQYLLALIVQTTGGYLQNLLSLSFDTHANHDDQWHQAWTIFYWGWWIAWAPFVGLFIARISRGRTFRQFVMGVLLVPTLITFVWLGVFGGNALYQELFGAGGISEAVQEDVTLAAFRTIEGLDAGIVGGVALGLITILIATYLVTSANAGIVVINMLLAHGGTDHRPVYVTIWGIALGLITVVLLLAGGLEALQAAVIGAALPYSVVILIMVAGLLRALEQERFAGLQGERSVPPMEPWIQSETEDRDEAPSGQA
jgi:choline/glycine/proline betaine transport protein